MNKKIVLVTIVAALFLFAKGVTAVTPSPSPDKQQKIAQICQNIEAKIQAKITRFEANKQKHITAYQNLKDRIEKFVKRIKAKGYDTTKLEADLLTLDSKIRTFAESYATFINLLRETKSYACGKSEGEFKAKLNEARVQLKIVHQNAADIRNYWKTVIREDLKEIKKQFPGATSNQTASPSPTATESPETE